MVPPERDETFTNQGVWHPAARVLITLMLFVVAASVLVAPVAVIAMLRSKALTPEAMQGAIERLAAEPVNPLFWLSSWLQLLGAAIVVVFATRQLDRQSISAIGLRLRTGWGRELAAGAGLGGALMLAAFLALWAVGLAIPGRSAAGPAFAVAVGVVTMVPMAIMEELVFRAYVLRNLAQVLAPWPALLLSSLVFGVAHATNPDAGPLPILNIVLAGVLIGYPYLRTGSLWLSLGLHFAWNFVGGSLLGMPVSGLGFPGVVDTLLRIPAWVSGSSFGPEGGVVATIVVLAGIGVLVRRLGPLPRRPVGPPSQA